MTKFEEEFEHELDYFIERELSLDEKLSFGARDVLVKFFSGWHSPEHIEKEIQMKLLKLQQQALPVVPECVAELIEWAKENGLSLKQIFVYDRYSDFPDADEWLGTNIEDGKGNKEHQDTFALAFITGKYEVEKPQLFYIELPNVYGLKNKVSVSKVENGTIVEFSNGKNYALKLTEQEIKSIDERYWQFAVPVEEVE